MDEGTSPSSSPSNSAAEAEKLQDVIADVCRALDTSSLEYDAAGLPLVYAKSSYTPDEGGQEDKDGADDTRLSLRRGDSVHVLDTGMGKGWWWVQVRDHAGYVPSSHLCSEDDLQDVEQRAWQDEEYFDQYATLKIHHEMLSDRPRTLAYQRAIQQCRSSIEGKVVLDVGCGTGILSLMCVRDGGAAHVYAVDASPITEQARHVVEANGYSDRITVIQGKIEDVDIPEQVDLILSEWMGTFLLFEFMLQSVLAARDLFLKADGILWPSDASLFLVPCMAREQVERVEFWKSVYGFDFSPLQEMARQEFHRVPIYNHELGEADCLSAPQALLTMSMKSVAVDDLEYHAQAFEFAVRQDGVLHGFASWFDVAFGGVGCGGGSTDEGEEERVRLSTGPDAPQTHWNQDLCVLDAPHHRVWTGDAVVGTLTVSRNAEWRRHMHVDIDFAIRREGEVVASASKRFGLWK